MVQSDIPVKVINDQTTTYAIKRDGMFPLITRPGPPLSPATDPPLFSSLPARPATSPVCARPPGREEVVVAGRGRG